MEFIVEHAEIKDYGIYRKLNTGKFEVVSICSDEYQDYFSIHKDDLERLLNEAGIKRVQSAFHNTIYYTIYKYLILV